LGYLKGIAKRALRASGLQRMALRWRPGNPLILMYHGVTRTPARGLQNAEGKHVGLDRFLEQLRFLKEHCRILPLSELVNGVVTGSIGRNAVAITFDDGYENNVTQAAPALDSLDLPATFFVATGFIDAARWMWVDRVEFALDRTTKQTLTFDGLGQIAVANKQQVLGIIKRFAKLLPEAEFLHLMTQLDAQCGAPADAPHGDYRFMSWKQVKELSTGRFAVGAHTVNHPILSRVDPAQSEREILGSRDAILREVGACSEVFCYPNGKAGDYTPEVMACTARHFQAALATNRGAAHASERYQLRRIGVSDATTVDELASVLLRER
jgi:peptidoglycan/xylan/chitin deacetylase (PgdA/CDA1 family)